MSKENDLRTIARRMFSSHGHIEEVKGGSSDNPIITFSDGYVINVSEEPEGTDISLMTYGYGGTGPSCAHQFMIEAGFDISYEEVKAMKEGDVITGRNKALSKGEIPYRDGLLDGNYVTRQKNAHKFRELDDEAFAALAKEFKNHPSPKTRWKIAEVYGYMEDARGVVPLLEALKDPDEEVREDAKKALNNIKGPEAADAALPYLQDENETVKRRL